MTQLSRACLFLLFFSATLSNAQQPDTVRVVTYNLLRFSDNSGDRIPLFRSILNEIRPQILMIQEVANLEGGKLFADSVLGTLDSPLQYGTLFYYSDNQDSYVGIWVDTNLFTVVDSGIIFDEPRVQGSLSLKHKSSQVPIAVISAHYRAGDQSNDEYARLINASNTKTYSMVDCSSCRIDSAVILFGGDVNLYAGTEPAYSFLTEQLPPGHVAFDGFRDAYNVLGRTYPLNWHDNPAVSEIHTQSTRTRQFGGGVGGGLDDRFDQIMVSQFQYNASKLRLLDYQVYGNDGNHFNDSINALPNTAVRPDIAQALHDASDHLPVVMTLLIGGTMTGVEERKEDGPESLELSEASMIKQ